MIVDFAGVATRVISDSLSAHLGTRERLPSWKNRQNSLVGPCVVRPKPVGRCGVGRHVYAGKGAKLVCKVSLVVESAFNCHFSPAHVGTGAQLPHCALKPLQPVPHLRRESNLLTEHLRKSAFAPASAPGELGDRE